MIGLLRGRVYADTGEPPFPYMTVEQDIAHGPSLRHGTDSKAIKSGVYGLPEMIKPEI